MPESAGRRFLLTRSAGPSKCLPFQILPPFRLVTISKILTISFKNFQFYFTHILLLSQDFLFNSCKNCVKYLLKCFLILLILHIKAAVYIHGITSHIAGQVAGVEQHRVSNVLGSAVPAQGDIGLGVLLGPGERFAHRRQDIARTHSVGGNVVCGAMKRKAFAQVQDAGLGRPHRRRQNFGRPAAPPERTYGRACRNSAPS